MWHKCGFSSVWVEKGTEEQENTKGTACDCCFKYSHQIITSHLWPTVKQTRNHDTGLMQLPFSSDVSERETLMLICWFRFKNTESESANYRRNIHEMNKSCYLYIGGSPFVLKERFKVKWVKESFKFIKGGIYFLFSSLFSFCLEEISLLDSEEKGSCQKTVKPSEEEHC